MIDNYNDNNVEYIYIILEENVIKARIFLGFLKIIFFVNNYDFLPMETKLIQDSKQSCY